RTAFLRDVPFQALGGDANDAFSHLFSLQFTTANQPAHRADGNTQSLRHFRLGQKRAGAVQEVISDLAPTFCRNRMLMSGSNKPPGKFQVATGNLKVSACRRGEKLKVGEGSAGSRFRL